MSTTTNRTILNLITVLIFICTMVQGALGLPMPETLPPETITFIGTATFIVANILTVWKQWFSHDIADKAIQRTLFFAIVATVVGIADLFKLPYFHFSDITAQWIRFVFTLIALGLSMISKIWYPSEAAIAAKQLKQFNDTNAGTN